MKYLILGASAAGVNAARELRKLDKEAQIIVAAKEKQLFSRCILHHYIEGIRDDEAMKFAGPNVMGDNNIDFKKGYLAISVDEVNKTVSFENGEVINYDKLLIATGSSPFIPPIPGLREGKQVTGLKELEDAKYIKDFLKTPKKVAIIGCGLIGVDALEAVVHKDCEVHIIDGADRLLNLQLDERSSNTYLKAFKKFNVKEHFNVFAENVILDDNNNVKSLKLANGEVIDIDLIIVAAGTRANISFLEGTNIEVQKKGLVFNKYGETNIDDVYGAGDVSGVHPIWPMAVKEGVVAAHNMYGKTMVMDDMFASKSTMNFLNIPTLSLGIHSPKENEGYDILISEENDTYRKLVLKDGYIVGAIIQGNLEYAGVLTQLIKRKIDVNKLKINVFKINYSSFFDIDDKAIYHYKKN